MDKRHGTGRTRAPRARPREPTYGPGNLPRQHPARPLSPRASRQERMDRLVAGKPPWAQMTVTSVRAPSAPLCSGASRGHAPSGCGQATEAGSACPPSPVAAPCTGHSAVGPPSPQSPPEPPTTPITLLSSKAPPLASPAPLPCPGPLGLGPLAPRHLPQCPFPDFLASLTTTNHLQVNRVGGGPGSAGSHADACPRDIGR